MIKTISKEEAKFLRKILPAYYLHILKYPDTLINRFYGMHRVKPHAKDEFRFLVMGSVFYTNLPIHVVFDLKGSTLGRECSEKEKKTRELPILKDNDFTEMKQTINLGKTLADKFSAQIEADSKLLSELGIMDYSLLVGIHYRNKRPGRGRDSEAQDPASPEPPVDVSSPTKVAMTPEKQAPIASPVPDFSIDPPLEGTRSRTPSRKQREDESDEKSKSERELDKERLRRVSVHASKKYKAAATPHLSAPKLADEAENLISLDDLEDTNTAAEQAPDSLFTMFSGGCPSVNSDGTLGNEIYFMGVIDILIEYGNKKALEYATKKQIHPAHTISCQPPDLYAARFSAFLSQNVRSHPEPADYKAWVVRAQNQASKREAPGLDLKHEDTGVLYKHPGLKKTVNGERQSSVEMKETMKASGGASDSVTIVADSAAEALPKATNFVVVTPEATAVVTTVGTTIEKVKIEVL